MSTFKNIFFAAFVATNFFAVTNSAQAAVSGLYYDHTGRSAIQVSRCGSGLCGRIVWLKNKAHESVCGTAIIGGGKKVGNSYFEGLVAICLLIGGGLAALQAASISTGLPFALVLVLMCVSILKGLRAEES